MIISSSQHIAATIRNYFLVGKVRKADEVLLFAPALAVGL